MKNGLIIERKNTNDYDPWFDFLFKPYGFECERRGSYMNNLETDIIDNEKTYIFKINVPGVKKEDISIEFENKYLTISLSVKEENDDVNYIKKERYLSELSRRYYVGDVDDRSISASLVDGVLTITMPKKEPMKTNHKIEID